MARITIKELQGRIESLEKRNATLKLEADSANANVQALRRLLDESGYRKSGAAAFTQADRDPLGRPRLTINPPAFSPREILHAPMIGCALPTHLL